MAFSRQLGNYIGYVAIVAFYLALARIPGHYFGGMGFDSLEVSALFDAVGGAVLGGIAIVSLISRKMRPVSQSTAERLFLISRASGVSPFMSSME